MQASTSSGACCCASRSSGSTLRSAHHASVPAVLRTCQLGARAPCSGCRHPAGTPRQRASTCASSSDYAQLSSLLGGSGSKAVAPAGHAAHTTAVPLVQRAAAAASPGSHLPLATISRILLVVQPQNLFRGLSQRRPAVSGPISLLLFLAGMILAAWAALRAALVRRVRGCSTCRGFGIVRCSLCAGQGKVDWKAKFSYSGGLH